MENTKRQLITVPQDFTFGETEADALELDCGRKLRHVNLRYETAGELNADKSNAILVFHALSGDAHVCGRHAPEDKKPGWWDNLIGPGKYVDTDRYFVVCSNIIGGCSGSTGPRSIDPDTGKPYNLDFPVVTVYDMVKAQRRLTDHLGIRRWLAVIGGSMGGMQALEWAVKYPDMVQSVIPIATTTQMSPQGISFDWVGREAILGDPEFNHGNYDGVNQIPRSGLSAARMLAHITYLSYASMKDKFGRDLQEYDDYQFGFKHDFAVESYLEYQGRRFVERFDANSYLYITRATDYFDLAHKTGGDIAKALEPATADFLVVSFSTDWLFPTEQSLAMVDALLKNGLNVSFCEIESRYGHDAFLLEVDRLGVMVRDFLANQFAKRRQS